MVFFQGSEGSLPSNVGQEMLWAEVEKLLGLVVARDHSYMIEIGVGAEINWLSCTKTISVKIIWVLYLHRRRRVERWVQSRGWVPQSGIRSRGEGCRECRDCRELHGTEEWVVRSWSWAGLVRVWHEVGHCCSAAVMSITMMISVTAVVSSDDQCQLITAPLLSCLYLEHWWPGLAGTCSDQRCSTW